MHWRGIYLPSSADKISNVFLRLVSPTCRNRPGFQIVAVHGPAPRRKEDPQRNQSIIEEIGFFDPTINQDGKKICIINVEKIRWYISKGAEPTIPVWKLLCASGAFPVHPSVYVAAAKNQYAMDLFPPQPLYDQVLHDEYPQDDSNEDRLNQYAGIKKLGDLENLTNFMDDLEPDHIQKLQLQQMWSKMYWSYNYFNELGNGPHFNKKKTFKEEYENLGKRKKEHWYWTRTVRNLKPADPFKMKLRQSIHRKGENEELLKSTRF